MKKMISLFWILSIFSSSLISCSSDSDTSDSVTLLKKIQSVDLGKNATYQFSYTGTKLTKVAFEIEAQTDGIGYDKYTYTNDLITEIKTFNSDNQVVATATLTYNSNNQLAEVVKLQPSENYGLRTVFNYALPGTVVIQSYSGNLQTQEQFTNQTTTLNILNGEITREQFQSDEINYTIDYEYDMASNPMKNVTGYNAMKIYSFISVGLFGMNQNLVKQTTSFNSNAGDNQINFEAQYNTNNFPTSRYAIGDFSGVYQYQYEYY